VARLSLLLTTRKVTLVIKQPTAASDEEKSSFPSNYSRLPEVIPDLLMIVLLTHIAEHRRVTVKTFIGWLIPSSGLELSDGWRLIFTTGWLMDREWPRRQLS
jgi:hypothetical protein